ncbi:hypothetical protein LCM20_06405 [Halobacillus litoralis]|uniref:hypothetical protein n=1 Tax=Halobacillus litoralis TaxID=45668 RepID=UPI001CD3D4C2|nr:hypothetical protein [Halobacillus litoralis]MCA0970212.1 hypothetical protein [Halobacillus litoralis]
MLLILIVLVVLTWINTFVLMRNQRQIKEELGLKQSPRLFQYGHADEKGEERR